MKLTVALFGNPNCGKTTLFNELSGSQRAMGNWVGTTVGLQTGQIKLPGLELELVDIPGLYSLATISPEQQLAQEYLNHTPPDLLINVVDSTNLQRNLFLTSQLLELGLPMIIALNLTDELEKQGQAIDAAKLTALLGQPCLPIAAATGRGLPQLLALIADIVQAKPAAKHKTTLEQGKAISSSQRYQLIDALVSQVLQENPLMRRRQGWQKIDAIICHKYLAFPIFLLLMLAVFYLAFGPLGSYLGQAFSYLFNNLFAAWASAGLSSLGAASWLISLIVEGIIAGVGAVMVFLPQLAILFLCFTLLEFSGYLARAAFISDKLLAWFGLSGMSFIPLILGFGCSVPALMACRVLDNRPQRLLTMLVIPFFSCSARMPVYALFAGVFFAQGQYLVIFSLYLLGIVIALVSCLLLGPKIIGRQKPLFIMEMPPYRKPIAHCIWNSLWLRLWDFILRAGTVILLASIVVWFLSNFNLSLQMVAAENSLLASIGKAIAPLFSWHGFGYWQIAVALIAGFMAKEAIISTLGVLYAGTALPVALTGLLSPAAAYALLVFVLLYTPCVATLATMKRESGSAKYTLLMMVYQLAIAWIISLVVYRLLSLF